MKRTGMLAMAFGVMAMGLASGQQQPPPGGGGGMQPSFQWATYDTLDANGNPVVKTSPRFFSFQDQPDGPDTKYCMGATGYATWYPVQMVDARLKYRIGTNGVLPDAEQDTWVFYRIHSTIYGQGNMIQGYNWSLTGGIGSNTMNNDPSTYTLRQGQTVSCGFRVKFSNGDIFRLGSATVPVQKS